MSEKTGMRSPRLLLAKTQGREFLVGILIGCYQSRLLANLQTRIQQRREGGGSLEEALSLTMRNILIGNLVLISTPRRDKRAIRIFVQRKILSILTRITNLSVIKTQTTLFKLGTRNHMQRLTRSIRGTAAPTRDHTALDWLRLLRLSRTTKAATLGTCPTGRPPPIPPSSGTPSTDGIGWPPRSEATWTSSLPDVFNPQVAWTAGKEPGPRSEPPSRQLDGRLPSSKRVVWELHPTTRDQTSAQPGPSHRQPSLQVEPPHSSRESLDDEHLPIGATLQPA
nr:hypothetical protein Iba_chr05cCG19550 [Ipomoea batatas]